MSEAIKIAQKYFDLSNGSNFEEIEKLFTQHTTYSSQNTGIYLGVKEIIKMQKIFHAKFEKLTWDIKNIEEVKMGVVLVEFDFFGKTTSGEKMNFSGTEYIVVFDKKIQHIEIRNKD